MFKTLQKHKCKCFDIYLTIFNFVGNVISKLIYMFANKSK